VRKDKFQICPAVPLGIAPQLRRTRKTLPLSGQRSANKPGNALIVEVQPLTPRKSPSSTRTPFRGVCMIGGRKGCYRHVLVNANCLLARNALPAGRRSQR
jgi:hypothetical protein